jgi:ParB/RepB/Spo0J family partition protein
MTTTTEEIARPIPIALLLPSPLNPRKHLRGIATLTESVRTRGVIAPLIVRPMGDAFEIGDGSRRRIAAEQAGLDTAPAIVREMSDLEMLELMVVSHTQHEDLHPLDEADGYAALMARGYDVDGLAARVSKERAHIRRRLELLKLGEPARTAYLADVISTDIAFVVARVPVELQPKVLEGLAIYDDATAADATRIVRERFTLRLADARFDPADPTLYGTAGACTTCPKRTSNQRELFADFDADDLCTDSICWGLKVDAEYERRQRAGAKVLSTSEASKTFSTYGGGVMYDAPYLDMNAKRFLEGGVERTIREILGPDAPEPLIARDGAGQLYELVPRSALPSGGTKAAGPSSEERAVRKADRRKQQIAETAHARTLAACAAAAPKVFNSLKALALWRVVAHRVLLAIYPEKRLVVAKAHALEKGEDPTTMLSHLIDAEKEPGVQGLVVEMLSPHRAPTGGEVEWASMLKVLGVDAHKILAAVEAEYAAKDGKKAKPPGWSADVVREAKKKRPGDVTAAVEKSLAKAKAAGAKLAEKPAKAGKGKKKPDWSPEAKAAAAERMKKYWATAKTAKAKG